MEQGVGDVALVQDDDYLVLNWDEILKTWDADRTRLVTCLYPWHLQRDCQKRWRKSDGAIAAHEVLLGWGSAFDWRLVEQALHGYVAKYGKTQEFCREADRIFSLGLCREHVVLPAKTLPLYGEQMAGVAMYRAPEHLNSIIKARTNALALLGIKYEHCVL
jgi:hypothetical protein